MRDHGVKQTLVIGIIPFGEKVAFIEVGRKNVGILVDGAVLYCRIVTSLDRFELIETGIQKVYLQVKGPALHVFVKIRQVGIVIYCLKFSLPTVMFC